MYSTCIAVIYPYIIEGGTLLFHRYCSVLTNLLTLLKLGWNQDVYMSVNTWLSYLVNELEDIHIMFQLPLVCKLLTYS